MSLCDRKNEVPYENRLSELSRRTAVPRRGSVVQGAVRDPVLAGVVFKIKRPNGSVPQASYGLAWDFRPRSQLAQAQPPNGNGPEARHGLVRDFSPRSRCSSSQWRNLRPGRSGPGSSPYSRRPQSPVQIFPANLHRHRLRRWPATESWSQTRGPRRYRST